MKKVAVERALSNVKGFLEENNFVVDILESKNKNTKRSLNRYDAIVVTGADENLMGIQDTITNTQVINAQGKTPEDIFNEIENRTRI